jgi:cell division protein YceG involved in septum cleavage
VQKGEVCREVADKLYSKGLVSDADEFRKYMQKKGYDNRICIGSFTIKQGMTYEEIAKILVENT